MVKASGALTALMTLHVVVQCLTGCGGTPCGDGTIEREGECVAADDFLKCGVGFRANGSQCEPLPDWVGLYCGDNTEYKDGKCMGKGGIATCDRSCGSPNGNKICVSGRVFSGLKLFSHGATAVNPVAKSANAVVEIYDPFEFSTTPNPTPIGTGEIYNDLGCFLVKTVTVPFNSVLLFFVADGMTGTKTFVRVGFTETATFNQNMENIDIPAFTAEDTNAWGQDLMTKGSVIFFYRKKGTMLPIEGVTPTMENQEPPWTSGSVFFFDADPGASPYFNTNTKVTTTAGLVAAREIPFTSYGGKKSGCTIEELTFQSVVGNIFIAPFNCECN